MTNRQRTYVHPPDPEREWHRTVDGRAIAAGDTIEVTGATGSFTVKYFRRDEVHCFGGPKSFQKSRVFKVDRIVAPQGSATLVAQLVQELKPDAIRDAIARDGRVEVPLQDPDDKAERKRVTNTIFTRAYSLGLKGKFKVRVVNGVAIGETKETS